MTRARITVLPATPADEGDALRLLDEMERHYEGADAVPAATHAVEAVQALLEAGAPWLGMLLARGADGRALGFATFSVVFPTDAFRPGLFAKDIFVSAPARRQAVGRASLKGLAREALRRGCARVDWATGDDNTAAHALYEGVGAGRMREAVLFRLDEVAMARLAGETDR